MSYYAAFPSDVSQPPVIVRAARDPRPADLPTIGWVEGPFESYVFCVQFAQMTSGQRPVDAAAYLPFWPKEDDAVE